MDDRLRNGTWKRRSQAASVPPRVLASQDALLHAPIGDDYEGESTEWTPLTRRSAAARAYTPVPVSRRTGLIAGGVVLAGGGLGVIGVSALALTVGLVAGAVIAADRLAPPAGPLAQHMPDAEVHEGAPLRVEQPAVAAVAPAEAAEAAPAPSVKASTDRRSSSRRTSRSRQAAPTGTRTAPAAPAAPEISNVQFNDSAGTNTISPNGDGNQDTGTFSFDSNVDGTYQVIVDTDGDGTGNNADTNDDNDQFADNVDALVQARLVHGSTQFRVWCVHICFRLHQQLDNGQVPRGGSSSQRWLRGINSSTVVQQQLHMRQISTFGSHVKRTWWLIMMIFWVCN